MGPDQGLKFAVDFDLILDVDFDYEVEVEVEADAKILKFSYILAILNTEIFQKMNLIHVDVQV